MGSAADAARELLARRLDGWRAWWRANGHAVDYGELTAEQRNEAGAWLRRLIEARRRGELDARQESGLRSIARRLFHDDAFDVLTEDEAFDLLTLDCYCSGCRRVTRQWVGKDGTCVECFGIPSLTHSVHHCRRQLTFPLAPETRARVESWLARLEQRLHDAEEAHATALAAGDVTQPWRDDA